ncbi:MAG TPA: PspC domain-containing protein [Steroidobacteraceae bacterium]|nr:PspC domain-containing protein [Steroidobacteraceae bacterium]
MRKVTLVSLGGNAYQLEEAAHEQIASYLDRAGRSLAGNPDRAEILADLEQAIADKCDSFLGKHKNVISADEAAQILREMGPVLGNGAQGDAQRQSDGGPEAAEDYAGFTYGQDAADMARRKRLMRIPSEGMVGGVCAGFAAYLHIDVVWVRLGFVLLTLCTGVWFFAWLVLLIVMPAARTPEQVASVRGDALSAREVMEMARRKSAEFRRAAASGLRDAEQNLRHTFRPRN